MTGHHVGEFMRPPWFLQGACEEPLLGNNDAELFRDFARLYSSGSGILLYHSETGRIQTISPETKVNNTLLALSTIMICVADTRPQETTMQKQWRRISKTSACNLRA